jgi:hypothetical protein
MKRVRVSKERLYPEEVEKGDKLVDLAYRTNLQLLKTLNTVGVFCVIFTSV